MLVSGVRCWYLAREKMAVFLGVWGFSMLATFKYFGRQKADLKKCSRAHGRWDCHWWPCTRVRPFLRLWLYFFKIRSWEQEWKKSQIALEMSPGEQVENTEKGHWRRLKVTDKTSHERPVFYARPLAWEKSRGNREKLFLAENGAKSWAYIA